MHLRPNEGKWEATRLGPSLEQKVVEELHGCTLRYLQMLLYFYDNQGRFETNSAAQEMKNAFIACAVVNYQYKLYYMKQNQNIYI